MKFTKIVFAAVLLLVLPECARSQILWDQNLNLAPSQYGNNHPRIVINRSGDPVVVWGRSSDGAVFCSTWEMNQFTTPQKLNGSIPMATASWMGPDIAAYGDTIYVVMKQTPEDNINSHLWIVASFNGGKSFNAPARIESISDSISRFPTVCTDSQGQPIVAFMKFSPGFTESRWAVCRSDDYGVSFNKDIKASGWGNSTAICDCCPASIACKDNVCILLYRDNNRNIRDSWAAFSYDDGKSFVKGTNIDNNRWNINSCPASGPDGAILDQSLLATFMNGSTGKSLAYWSLSDIPTSSFKTATRLPASSGSILSQNFPRIDAYGQAVAMVWREDVITGTQLMMQFSPDYKKTGLKMDTVDLKDNTASDIALSKDRIFVVWQDDNSRTIKYRSAKYENVLSSSNYDKIFFSISPSPITDFLHVRSEIYPASIEVFDATGSLRLMKFLFNDEVISTALWPRGTYLARLTAAGKTAAAKIIKLQ